jgi:hypothetical protein
MHPSPMAYVTIVLVFGLLGSDLLGIITRLRDRNGGG